MLRKLYNPNSAKLPLRPGILFKRSQILFQARSSTTMPETHVEELTFTPDEEPNMLGSDKGYGYFPVLLGQTILAGKYELVRKLGYGSNSTVWLAKDSK